MYCYTTILYFTYYYTDVLHATLAKAESNKSFALHVFFFLFLCFLETLHHAASILAKKVEKETKIIFFPFSKKKKKQKPKERKQKKEALLESADY